MKEKILFWTPRILSILTILFMMIFSIDCFGGNYSISEQLICFVMHNIPAFICILLLIIAWKREMAGGILFLLAAMAGSIYFRGFAGNPGVLIVLSPFVITGIMFILHQGLFKPKKIT